MKLLLLGLVYLLMSTRVNKAFDVRICHTNYNLRPCTEILQAFLLSLLWLPIQVMLLCPALIFLLAKPVWVLLLSRSLD